MWKKSFKMTITILLVPIIIIIGAYTGGIIGWLTASNLVNECSNCDDFVVNGLRGYESLGYLGSKVGRRIGFIFGLIISLIIFLYRIKKHQDGSRPVKKSFGKV